MSYLDSLHEWESARGAHGPKPRVDLFAAYCAQDEILVRHGMPPTPPWWLEQFRNFYAGGFRRLVARVGRKGTKSSTGCRFAVNEVLNGQHTHRPGDILRWPLLSVNKGEARDRITMLRAILGYLGREVETRHDDMHIVGTDLAFSVRAATVNAVSGPISVGFTLDELCKWTDRDSGANPASIVIESLTPSTLTQPHAHQLWISSPWAQDDPHFEAMERGTIEGVQYVCDAPSWVANDTVSEQATKDLATEEIGAFDEVYWMREYAAIPMAQGTGTFFDVSAIKEAVKRGAVHSNLLLPRRRMPGDVAGAGADFAFKRDASAAAVVHRFRGKSGQESEEIYALADLLEQTPKPGAPLKPSIIAGNVARLVRQHSIGSVMCDVHEASSMAEHLETHGLEFIDAPTGAIGKMDSYSKVRALLHQGHVMLTDRDELSKRLVMQLGRVTCTPQPGGLLRIESPRVAGGGHGDIVSAYVLAMWVAALGSTAAFNPGRGVLARFSRPGSGGEHDSPVWADNADDQDDDDGGDPFGDD